MAATALPQRVTAVRRFNRFYTKQIGLLHEHLLRSPFSLTAARVLYELAHRATTTATDLGGELGLDAGYLSRVLRRFQIRGLLDRKPSQSDVGGVIQRQGALCARKGGGGEAFGALAADIAAKFIRHYDPKRERCWIVELDGENVGSVFCIKKTEAVARLRLLLVEPRARGLGIGKRLVEQCVRFARKVGYRKLTLWTNDVLQAARRIYEQTGLRLVHEEPHHGFGYDLVGQTWDLDL